MKIISWNVNGLRAVEKKGAIQMLIDTKQPDILFLQEIKGFSTQFSSYLQDPPGYVAQYNSAEKAGYAGTGIWISKELSPYVRGITTDFPGNPVSSEGRIIQIDIAPPASPLWNIFGIYFPNGGKSEDAWQDKLVFYDAFLQYINSLHEQGNHVIWGGDINCAHQAIDLARPRENDGKIGFHPKERQWLDTCVDQNWLDIWRTKFPTTTDMYSWWDTITRARTRNVGWRLDAFWTHKKSFQYIKNPTYLTEQMGSDHCPVSINCTIPLS